MVYESSYESGRLPFLPDTKRGTWEQPTDFIYACLGLGFKMDVFSISWLYFVDMGILAVVPYMICLALYVVPMMVMQSFMGQFSSSGFISSFRISPLFKGMGFVSLALNCSIVTYYSQFVAVPLLYFFHSLRPTLPWSCEAFAQWAPKLNMTEDEIHICNITKSAVPENETSAEQNSTEYESSYKNYHIPSVLFFRSHFDDFKGLFYNENEFDRNVYHISWELVLCTLLTWSIVAGVFYKFFSTEKFGKLLRYTLWGTLVCLLICLARFLFLPGAVRGMSSYFSFSWRELEYGLPSIPVYVMTSFGSGWGCIVSLSSMNKFKTNIMRYSWIICVGQMAVTILFGMASHLVERHFEEITDDNYYSFVEHHWVIYLSSASAIATMELANMWSLLFYGMLTVAALILMVTHIYSILISVFDEFVYLRENKTKFTFSLIGVLALLSLYFCSNHGIVYFTALSADSVFTQTALNLLLILVVCWVYGRERFQRDLEFMLGQRFATWKVNMLRFVSPICLLFVLFLAIVLAVYEHIFSSVVVAVFAILFIVLPWLFIPGYAIFTVLQTSGSFGTRFKRCCKPTDWYPVEADDRQRYEEAMGNMDITHQLNEVGEDVL